MLLVFPQTSFVGQETFVHVQVIAFYTTCAPQTHSGT